MECREPIGTLAGIRYSDSSRYSEIVESSSIESARHADRLSTKNPSDVSAMSLMSPMKLIRSAAEQRREQDFNYAA